MPWRGNLPGFFSLWGDAVADLYQFAFFVVGMGIAFYAFRPFN